MDLQVWVSCYATHASVASLPRKDGNGRDSEFFAWNLAIFQSLREREAKSLVAIQYIKDFAGFSGDLFKFIFYGFYPLCDSLLA